ncbi:MAG: HAD family phosphatase [Myxococcota bacterium]
MIQANDKTEQSPKHAVWFDFGGVLTPPVQQTVAAFCARVGASEKMLLTAMTVIAKRHGTSDIMEPLDTPLVSEEEWSRQMEAEVQDRFGVTIDMSNFGAKWFTDRDPNQELVTYIQSLRSRGLFVGMLSNMVPSWDVLWRKMVHPDSFDQVVKSFDVGTRKPRLEIYALARRLAGVPAQNCILIDDLIQNIEGARQAGWKAVHYRDDNKEAIEETERLLRM